MNKKELEGLHRRARRGSLMLRYVPAPLLEYPLEVMLALWALLSSVTAVFFEQVPESITNLLPDWAAVVWSVALGVGGVAVVLGLHFRWYATFVPRGMQLIAAAATCNAFAILANRGFGAFPSALLMLIIGLVLFVRAWFLQIRESILRDIAVEVKDWNES